MNPRDVRLWTTLVSVIGVLAFVAWDSERTSPGPLAAVHEQVPELASAESCSACHGGWLESMDAACLACHEPIEAQLEQRSGLHGALARTDCAECHSDHNGPDFRLAGAASFALAGFPSGDDFDHGHVEFALGGVHAELNCAECHAAAELEVLPEGTHRFLGAEQACSACHADPHEGRFARSCESCHGQELPFAEVASFSHTDTFPLTGGHAPLAITPLAVAGGEHCERCHEPGGPYAIEALAGRTPAPAARDCGACHGQASPHDERFLAEVVALRTVPPGASCALCHDAEHGGFAGEAVAVTAELHAATGFALEGPHEGLGCADCHGAEGDFGARFPGRVQSACASCHEDPHEGQFERGAFAGEGCLACHREATFRPPAFDLDTHARTAFPLEGTHRAVACSACHALEADEAPRAFVGTPSECEACHPDPHAPVLFASREPGPLTAFASPAAITSKACEACHVPEVFSEVVEGTFDHALDAGYALEGAHADVACSDCHDAAPPDALQETHREALAGRAFGLAASSECAGCHASVHGEFFREESCASCHRPTAFAELARTFEHGLDTGYPLEGAHARAACEACHGTYPEPELAGRRLGRVAQLVSGPLERCASCHADPHAGAFDRPGLPAALETPFGEVREGCARCHDEESFRELSAPFDHGLWTGHELSGAHAALECAACHAPLGVSGPGERSFAQAAGTACSACHADPHLGQFAAPLEVGAAATDCARCHLEAESFRELLFDHQRDARFSLDASHAGLECAACHRPYPLPDGGTVVRFKPLGTRCVDCHDHGGRGGSTGGGPTGGRLSAGGRER